MKRFRLLLVLGTVWLVTLSSPASADVPQLLNLQGILRDGSGDPVADGSYNVTFSIYDAAAGGSVLWTESHLLSTTDGLFSVLLGSITPVPDSIFFDTSRYLGITVPPDPEMTPRQRLSSTGYSFVSSQWTSAGPNLYRMSGSVGIGTPTPLSPLVVQGASNWGVAEVVGNGTNVESSIGFRSANLAKGALGTWVLGVNNNAGPANAFSLYAANGLGAGSQAVTVLTSGFVGIGTSTPSAQLQVHDVTNSTNGSRIQLTQAASGSSLVDGTALISASPRSFLWNYENGPLMIGTNNVERVRVDSIGNVGIGLSTPTVRVHTGSVGSEGTPVFIAGTHVAAQATNPDNWTHMAIISGSAGRARLNFGDGFNDDQGIVSYDNSVDAMAFATANSEKVRITSAGRVGVGTNAPQGALDVVSTTGAFIVPRMTTAERDGLTAVNGMIVYNTSTNQFNFREAGAWVTK